MSTSRTGGDEPINGDVRHVAPDGSGRGLEAVTGPENPDAPIPGGVAPDVVRRARAGDDRAFAQLVEHYDLALRRLVHTLLEDVDRTDHVLSDAYVKAYRALPRFRGTTTPGVWLYRIVYSTCVDELRRHVHHPVEPAPAPATTAGPAGPVAKALAVLPVELRALVLMVDGDEFEHLAAAEVLGLDPAAVPVRLARARTLIRHALAHEARVQAEAVEAGGATSDGGQPVDGAPAGGAGAGRLEAGAEAAPNGAARPALGAGDAPSGAGGRAGAVNGERSPLGRDDPADPREGDRPGPGRAPVPHRVQTS